MTSPLLNVFGIREASLARALNSTDGKIHGGAALSWYLESPPPPGQDIDIWCPLSDRLTLEELYDVYNTLLTKEGNFMPLGETEQDYKTHDPTLLNIFNWQHPASKRRIQVIIHSASVTPTDKMDLDITTLSLLPSAEDPTKLVIQSPSPDLLRRIRSRTMRINNLPRHNLSILLGRVAKYYERGFAFEVSDSTPAVIVLESRRLTLEEAHTYVRAQWTSMMQPVGEKSWSDTIREILHPLAFISIVAIMTIGG